MKSKFGNSSGDTAFLVFFVFFILLLIILPTGGYCYANRDAIKVQIEEIKPKTETFVSTAFKGAKDYKVMSHRESLKDEQGKDACIFVLADWCGHCTRLKESGDLEVLSKDVPVRIFDDKHPEAQTIMQEVKSQGFPTIALMKNGKLSNYEGPREADSIRAAFMQ